MGWQAQLYFSKVLCHSLPFDTCLTEDKTEKLGGPRQHRSTRPPGPRLILLYNPHFIPSSLSFFWVKQSDAGCKFFLVVERERGAGICL
jgi:hypothetical protein